MADVTLNGFDMAALVHFEDFIKSQEAKNSVQKWRAIYTRIARCDVSVSLLYNLRL